MSTTTTRTGGRRRRSGAVMIGAVALAFGAVAGVGGAAQAGATPPPFGHLVLTVYDGEGIEGDAIASVELWCNPDAGSHPDPSGACAALTEAGGDPAQLAGDPGPCTMELAPVTAVAEGYWDGGVTPVQFTRTYTNRCDLHRKTTPVFDILEPTRR